MNNNNKISGFTLIELIVVIVIISTFLVFSFPVFENISKFSDLQKGQQGNIVHLINNINDLKKRAVKENIDFVMHIDQETGMIWITDDNMDDDAKKEAKKKYIQLSENITISDIQFFNIKETKTQEHLIRFRKQGYSDFALIHIREKENNKTLKIDPFLSRVQVLNKYVYFEDCI